jgi:protein required for attachment to host cells
MNGPSNMKPEFILKDSNFTPNLNLDQIITDESSEHIGQNPDDEISRARNQHEINKFLFHAQGVLAAQYEVYKLEGPEELFFRVTGSREGDGTNFIKDEGETEMDIQISFNTLQSDPEWMKNANETIAAVQANDASGLIDGDKLNLWRLSAVDPMLGEMITTSQAQGSEKIIKEVRSDISDMASGFAVSPAKTSVQARLKVCEEYIQEQQQVEAANVSTMLGQSPQFQQYLANYMEVLRREVEQGQNAQIGRNQAPVMVGSMNVEGVNGTAQ